jgi:signal transduction histidine kinase
VEIAPPSTAQRPIDKERDVNRNPDHPEASATVHRLAGTGPVVHPILLALAPVLGLFLVYEVVERLWLSDADLEFLHLLHRIRGVAAVLLAAGVASWLILRQAPPLLAAALLANERSSDSRIQADPKALHHARWFILMRWIAVVAAAVLVLAAVEIAEVLPRQVGPRLGAVIVGLALLNLLYALYLRRGRVGSGFLALQTYADVAALILLLHFSGGIENPLTPLVLLHVIIAGIVLGRMHSYLVAATASVLLALVAWGEWSGVLAHYTLSVFPHVHTDGQMSHAAHDALYAGSRVGLHAAILLLVAYFTTTLVERIRQDERQLEELADRALAQAQTLDRALDTTGTALCLCDRELRPYWANGRWTEWLEQVPEVGCSVTSCRSPAVHTLADGQVRVDEIRTPAAAPGAAASAGEPGGGRVFELTTAPLRDRDGQVSHVVTLAREVTKEQEAQARMVHAERLAAVGELAGQVAHEVNNPIAIISAKARLLLRDDRHGLPERAVQEICKITELADRVARIAQGLLSYCRPAPGMRAPQDIRLPIRRALAFIEVRAAQAGVRILDELPAALPPVRANAGEIEQVFLNLFLNSLDAVPRGGQLRITAGRSRVAPDDPREELAVVVADSGCGIPPAIRDRIFDPFLTTKSEGHGTGLGLSICLGLVRSHGGRIAVESEPGRYTRVTVTLPVVSTGAPSVVPDPSESWQEASVNV